MIPAGILNHKRLTIIGITIIPSSTSLPKGRSQQLEVFANWSDSTQTNITLLATYSRNNTNVTVTETGWVTTFSTGSSIVTASYLGFTSNCNITITSPVVDYLTISPTSVNIAQGLTHQLIVTAHWSDYTNTNVTGIASYSSSVPSNATVSSTGLVTASNSNTGNAVITASYAGESAQSIVTVTPAIVMGISASPNPITMPQYTTQQLTVMATMSNSSTIDVTTFATYTPDNWHVQIDSGGVKGLILVGEGPNTTGVTVAYSGQLDYIPITITG